MAYNYALPTGHQYLEARLVWDYTQDFNNNTSTIFAHVEARRTSSYMTTTDLSNPVMEIGIDGEKVNTNGNYNFGAHAVWEWFWIGSEVSKTVWHSNDGTRSLNITTWNSTSVSNLGSLYKYQSVTLNTIPRASTVSSGNSWVVGHEADIYINRRSTDFYHSVLIDIGINGVWQNFAVRYGVGSYIVTNFTQTEQQAMMDYFIAKGNPWEVKSRIRIETWNASGNQVGSTTESIGTIWRPSESSVSSHASLELATSGVPYTLSGVNSSKWITHSIKLYSSTFNKTISLDNGASTTGFITLTQANIDSIYALYTTQPYAVFNIEVTTMIAGKQLGDKNVVASNGVLTFNTSEIAPNFTVTPTYLDANSTIVAITGDNQHIVQNKSSLRIAIPATTGVAKYGATASLYSVVVNGVELTSPYTASATVFEFGTINVDANTSAQVSVIDSRGIRTTKTIQITIIPYSKPTIIGSALRNNGFDNSTTISATGSISSVNVKNAVTTITYRSKLSTSETWGSNQSMTQTTTNLVFTTNSPVVSFDNTLTYNIEITVTDKLGGTDTAVIFLEAGRPIIFIDKRHKSLGVGMFPTHDNSLEVAGDSYVNGSEYVIGNLSVTGTGGNVYTTSKKPTPDEIGASATSHTHTPASIGAEVAIIHGSNANGTYMKYDDGTLICHGNQFLTSNASSVSDSGMFYDPNQRIITFPTAFYSAPEVIMSGYDCMTIPLTPTKTNINYWIYRTWSGEGTFGARWTAKGRWKE